MSFDTAKGIINNLSDFKGNLNGHYSIYVCEPQRVFQSVAHVYLSHSVTEQSDYDGELIEGTTNIDNQAVSFRVLESNGLVFAIVVLPLLQIIIMRQKGHLIILKHYFPFIKRNMANQRL